MAVGVRGVNGKLRRYLDSLGLGPAAPAPALFGGAMAGLYVTVASLSYPALIFTGELQVHQATGIGMALVGSLILAAVVALTGSLPGTVAAAQSEAAALLGVMAGTVVAGNGGGGVAAIEEAALLATVVVLIVLSSAVLGLAFLLFGTFGLANLIRYVPYPVIGGFLAGIGWLVFGGGFAALTGTPLKAANLAALAQADALLRWAPALAVAAVLWALQRWRPHVLNLPGTVLATAALFWTAAWLTGASVTGLQSGGWLLGPFPGGTLWAPLLHAAALASADWDVVLQQLPKIGILVLICLITLLLSASGLELLVRQDIDLNRELRAAGAGNLLCGLAGGLPGYHSLSASSLACRAGVRARLVGLLIALLCALTLWLGGAVLPYVPRLVTGVLLLYIGLGFLIEALVNSWSRLPLAEYGVLVGVFLGIVLIGILEGIAIGVVAGVVLFAVNYSRINVVRQALSGSQIRSNVDRSQALRDLLRDRGPEIHVLKLQGYIFFGTGNRLLTGIRARLMDAAVRPLRFLVLDFKRVSGLDSSVLITFTKLTQYAEQYDFELILTSPAPEVADALRTAGIDESVQSRVRVFADLDYGLEYCEERILAGPQAGLAERLDPLENQLRRAFPDGAGVERLVGYLEKGTWREGERLIRQGDTSKDLFFIEAGRVSVQLEFAPGHTLRLRTMGAGTVVGELALYLGLPRSASVVADVDTTAYRLTAERLEAIKGADPPVAALFHEFMARMLAARLLDTNRLLEAYKD